MSNSVMMAGNELIEKAKADITATIAAYNSELGAKEPNKKKLDELETKVKKLCSALRTTMVESKINELVSSYENPVLESVRIFKIDCPSYKFIKNNGIITGMEEDTKPAELELAAVTEALSKCKAADGYVKKGVMESGMAWAVRAEKLAFLLALRVGREIGFNKDAEKAFSASYRMSEIARKEEIGQTPTSNSQVIKLMQSVVDALVWVDDDKFETNKIKCTSADVCWLLSVFTRHGRQTGGIGVTQGRRINSYLAEMLHMIVTGKPYTLEYRTGKNQSAVVPDKVREEIPSSARRAIEVKDEGAAA